MVDWDNPNTFNHKFFTDSDVKIHYVDEGNPNNPTVIFCHGWPDFWYGWRKQIHAVSSVGFRVIVPDLRGFGQSFAPVEQSKYSLKIVSEDLIKLLDYLKIQSCFWVGHDHGGNVVWRTCLHFPSRVIAAAVIATPYVVPREQFVPLETIVKIRPVMKYQEYFNQGDLAKQEFEQNAEKLFKVMLRGTHDKLEGLSREFLSMKNGPPLLQGLPKDIDKPTLLSQQALDYYVSNFKLSGFAGGLNYYRTHKQDWLDEKGLSKEIHKPILMITCGRDVVLTPDMTKKMGNYIPNLECFHLDNANHWPQQEFPNEVNSALISFLKKVSSSKL